MVNIHTETLAFETELYKKHFRYLHGSKSRREKTLAALDRHQLLFLVFLNLVLSFFFFSVGLVFESFSLSNPIHISNCSFLVTFLL